ncbi:MAG: hypothetical protein ACYDA1_09815, partial [Vulcanimicrobiaceae bacterium]
MRKIFLSSLFVVCASVWLSGIAIGQVPSAPTSASQVTSPLLLVPFEEPGSTDPHAKAITTALTTDLSAAGISTVTIAPVDHLDAVADASQLCAQNHASGLLVPEGRYEQTMKRISVSFFLTILKYPTHVALRLDKISCSGAVLFSTVATGDEAPSGVNSVGNLGAAVDSAFKTASKTVVESLVAAKPLPVPTSNPIAATSPAPDATNATPAYLLLSFKQPGLSDPRAGDITDALLLRLQKRGLNVTVDAPVDHLSTLSDSGELCQADHVTGIIVPSIRIEQSEYTGGSYASLHLGLVSCSGSILGHGSGRANI